MNSDSVLQIGFLGLSLWIVSALIDEERLFYNGEHDVPCSLTRLICIVNAMQIYNLFQRLPSVSHHIFFQKQKQILSSSHYLVLRSFRMKIINRSSFVFFQDSPPPRSAPLPRARQISPCPAFCSAATGLPSFSPWRRSSQPISAARSSSSLSV